MLHTHWFIIPVGYGTVGVPGKPGECGPRGDCGLPGKDGEPGVAGPTGKLLLVIIHSRNLLFLLSTRSINEYMIISSFAERLVNVAII